MSKCIKCGAENTDIATFCEKCGERLMGDSSVIEFSDKPKRNIKRIIIISVIIAILLVPISILGYFEFNYVRAKINLKTGDFETARKIYTEFKDYRKSEEMLDECDYQEATFLMNAGEGEKAKKIFSELGKYKDSSDMILECDYVTANAYIESGELLQAYELFEKLGKYKNSEETLVNLKPQLYQKGVELYQGYSFEEAKSCFEKSVDCGRETDYLNLIKARTSTISDITVLRHLLDFENTKDTILNNNEYMKKFLLGDWKDYINDKYLRYYYDDTVLMCKYDVLDDYDEPYEDLDYWRLSGGTHMIGDTGTNNWLAAWKYEILDWNTIKVTLSNNSSISYTLRRQ